MLLGRFAPQTFALLRIMSGAIFAMHGSMKLLGWPAMPKGVGPLPMLPTIGGIIELVGGLMIVVGFFSDFAAFIASGEMAVAYWKFHAPGLWWDPITNKGEPAVLFCFIFLFIAAHGSGIWSIDAAMRRGARVTS